VDVDRAAVVALDDRQPVPQPVGGQPAVEQQPRPSHHRVERRAQLVGHHGEELVLGAVGLVAMDGLEIRAAQRRIGHRQRILGRPEHQRQQVVAAHIRRARTPTCASMPRRAVMTPARSWHQPSRRNGGLRNTPAWR
jgi:hypothetical protein